MKDQHQTPFALPNPSDYLQLLSHQLSPNNSRFEQWGHFPAALPTIAAIIDIAYKLRAYPRLLYGANCLILPHFKIHCSTISSDVKHFVLSNQETHQCDIYSFTAGQFTPSSSRQNIQQLLLEADIWDRKFRLSDDNDWLACVAQVLQEILDDPQTEPSFRSSARTRLSRLSKAGVLPLSIFVHFVDSNIPLFESMREFSTSGGFCDAHKITVNGIPLCFRVLRQWETSDSDKAVYKQFCRELSVWHQLRHRNILPLIGATTEAFPGRYCFLVPWLSNGSLPYYLKTHPEYDKYLAVTQIVEGLNYMHSLDPPVGHKDLKGDNVLVRSDLVCVITDFGLASLLDTQRSTTLGRGSQYWRAPELGLEEVLNPDCRPRDIYSLGSTIAEILIGEPPKSIWFSVIRGITPTIPPPRLSEWQGKEQSLWSIAKASLEMVPERRPLVSDIKRYFQANKQPEIYQSFEHRYQPTEPILSNHATLSPRGKKYGKWGFGTLFGDNSPQLVPVVDKTKSKQDYLPTPEQSRESKNEAQRLHREAELEKRRLLEKFARDQARAVMLKRQQLLQKDLNHASGVQEPQTSGI